MMASLLGFNLLPPLNEGDERICLGDVLMLRDACLCDDELWAVCLETCTGIQDVNSSEMFQTLCITPESLAFDSSGAACFLDLATGKFLFVFVFIFLYCVVFGDALLCFRG